MWLDRTIANNFLIRLVTITTACFLPLSSMHTQWHPSSSCAFYLSGYEEILQHMYTESHWLKWYYYRQRGDGDDMTTSSPYSNMIISPCNYHGNNGKWDVSHHIDLNTQTDIPHFKQVIIMATICDYCGYRSNEVKSGTGISETGTRIDLKITDPSDLNRDILKVQYFLLYWPYLSIFFI